MKQKLSVIPLLLYAFCISGISFAQTVAYHMMTPAEYQKEFTDLSKKGYRLISLSGYTKAGQEKYAAIFRKDTGPSWTAKHGMNATQYQQAFTDMSKNGYRLRIISGYAVGNQAKFAAVWDKGSGNAWIAKHNMTATQYQQTFTENSNKGFQLKYISGYVVNGKEYFAAIWEKATGTATIAKHNMTAAQYQQYFTDFSKQGYTLKVVSGYEKNDTDFYAAIWGKTKAPVTVARHGLKGANAYQQVFDNMYYQGYVPVYINGFAADKAEKYNAIWENNNMSSADLGKIDDAVNKYMDFQSVTGLSLAVSKNGKLVYAKGFGYANPETFEEMSPNHTLRIMSVSKSVTAAGIMKLLDAKKITMNQKVFGPSGILGKDFTTPANLSQLNDITITQLLHHTSGLRTCNGEPVFWDKTKTKKDAMKVLLSDKNLFDSIPGTKYIYSNTGYFILSMVIEKLSEQSYENFIRRNVLIPSGVSSSMYVGLASGEIRKGEAHYIKHESPNMELWSGFGGWVARPIDLLQYLSKCDGSASPPDIFSSATHSILTDGSALKPQYGCGWIVNGTKQSHNGSHGPSRSWLAEIGDGLSVAIITNAAPLHDDNAHSQMLNEISEAVKSVNAFPNYNLF